MACWLAIALLSAGQAEAPRPAISVRILRPDLVDARVNALFDGSPAANPAVALANWRRATGETLNKSLEAAIALFNPDSARELAAFDDLRIAVGFDPTDGRVRWAAVAPRDDGTIDAALSAMALTGGSPEPPLPGGAAVDRLGMTAGIVLASKFDRGLAIARTREDLIAAIGRAGNDRAPAQTPIQAGILVSIDPTAFPNAGPIRRRRIGEALRGSGCKGLEASATLEGETASIVVSGQFSGSIAAGSWVDPAWLELIPSVEATAAFAMAVEPTPEALKSTFALIDRIERVDPTRANVAPSRVRLNLIASAAGIRPEVDVWPAIRGISGFILAGDEGRFGGGLIALHLDDEAAAIRIESEVLPRLARSAIRSEPGAIEPDGRRSLGSRDGKPLQVARRGRNVLVSWGSPAMDAALRALARRDGSVSSMLRTGDRDSLPRRFAAIWPGRLPGLPPRLAAALSASTLAVWRGDVDGQTTRDEIRWGGLRAAVRKFLEGLPMKPFER